MLCHDRWSLPLSCRLIDVTVTDLCRIIYEFNYFESYTIQARKCHRLMEKALHGVHRLKQDALQRTSFFSTCAANGIMSLNAYTYSAFESAFAVRNFVHGYIGDMSKACRSSSIIQLRLSYDQLRAALLIGRNAVTRRSA